MYLPVLFTKDKARWPRSQKIESIPWIFMAYRPLEKSDPGKHAGLKEQEIKPFQRSGFAVVEWGGCEDESN